MTISAFNLGGELETVQLSEYREQLRPAWSHGGRMISLPPTGMATGIWQRIWMPRSRQSSLIASTETIFSIALVTSGDKWHGKKQGYQEIMADPTTTFSPSPLAVEATRWMAQIKHSAILKTQTGTPYRFEMTCHYCSHHATQGEISSSLESGDFSEKYSFYLQIMPSLQKIPAGSKKIKTDPEMEKSSLFTWKM